jgi:hypothetical protein
VETRRDLGPTLTLPAGDVAPVARYAVRRFPSSVFAFTDGPFVMSAAMLRHGANDTPARQFAHQQGAFWRIRAQKNGQFARARTATHNQPQNGIQEVVSSILIGSTNRFNGLA